MQRLQTDLLRKLSSLTGSTIAVISAICAIAPNSAFAETHTFEKVAVEIDGTKFWLPSDIHVKKGDTVKLHLVSKVPGKNSVHGFAIEGYGIQVVADTKGVDTEFVANKSGVFKIWCHLHPAHVGGQLIVD